MVAIPPANGHRPTQTEGEYVFSSFDPSTENCSEGEIESVTHGRFAISDQLETDGPNVDHPSPGWARIEDLQVSGSDESWLGLHPKVECRRDTMSLVVRRKQARPLLLDRATELPVPLSQLPPACGYSVHTTLTDLVLKAQYDACHVTQEDDHYVLPLLWRSRPVKISCPVSQVQPGPRGLSSPCCFPNAMTVEVQGWSAAEGLRANVRGEWTPVRVLAEPCGWTVERQEAESLVTVPFFSCGVTVKDGKHTLSLQTGQKTFTLSCPISPIQELPQIDQPQGSLHLTRGQMAPVPGSLVSFPWAPPFYLAPLHYPHPTDPHRYPGLDVHAAYDQTEPPSSTHEPILGPQPLPPVDAQPDHRDLYIQQVPGDPSVHTLSAGEIKHLTQVYPHLWQEQKPPMLGFSERDSVKTTDFSMDVKAPTLQPPIHAFNPYYHYYYHPKIPLSRPPQNPDPGAEGHEELSSAHSPTEFSSVHQSKSELLFPPYTFPAGLEFVHKAPAPHAPHPPHPPPPHYFQYLPYVPQSGVGTLFPLHPDMSAETNLPYVHSLADKGHEKLYVDQPNTDKVISHPEGPKHPVLSVEEDVKPELEGKKHQSASFLPERPPFPMSVPNHYPPHHPFYMHPYLFYQMYYGLLSAEHQGSPTHKALDQPHIPTPPPSSTMSSGKAESDSQLPLGSDSSRLDPVVDVEAGYPPQLLYSPFYAYYSQPVTPSDALWRPGGGDADKRPDYKMEDHVKASAYTPSPCGLGPMSDFDCSLSLGCCSYRVKGCTVGQHYVFVVLEPIDSPPAHPSEDETASCTLTSDPGLYAVGPDGRGWNMHVFVPTAFDLLGVRSLQHHHTNVHGNAPVRSMDCDPVPLGEVRPHVMDQPTPPPVQSTPTIGTVHLRIATDQTFSWFHPEAHLPLSLVRGRPLYMEVRLLDAPEADLVLLVHSCLAYVHTPYPAWMLLYDRCGSQGESQLLPSPRSDHLHIWRIRVSSFQALPSESPSDRAGGGSAHLVDPEIFFFCWTEVCSAADGDCTVGCVHSPKSDV